MRPFERGCDPPLEQLFSPKHQRLHRCRRNADHRADRAVVEPVNRGVDQRLRPLRGPDLFITTPRGLERIAAAAAAIVSLLGVGNLAYYLVAKRQGSTRQSDRAGTQKLPS